MTAELMDDGENQAVRMFLALYGGRNGVTVPEMEGHLAACGFKGCWPDWVNDSDTHLTKGGAQDWLRHLFALEQKHVTASDTSAETVAKPLPDLPPRTWRSLTSAQKKVMWNLTKKPSEFADMVDAKLRELNT